MVTYSSGLRGRSAKALFIGSNPIVTSSISCNIEILVSCSETSNILNKKRESVAAGSMRGSLTDYPQGLIGKTIRFERKR